jgi:hypothetical protein
MERVSEGERDREIEVGWQEYKQKAAAILRHSRKQTGTTHEIISVINDTS